MAPNLHSYMMQTNNMTAEPVSRTYQYRKVMKPMLERKRRARINRCLDELKELMSSALQTEGENVAKLEKADILELTVRHLHTLRHQNQLTTKPETTYADRFRAGFRHCAVEVTGFLNGLDQPTKTHLTSHLSNCIRQLEGYPAAASPAPSVASAAAAGVANGPSSDMRPARSYNYSPVSHAAVSMARQQPAFPMNHESPEDLQHYHQRMMIGGSPSPSSDKGPASPGSATSDENVWRPW